MLIVASLGRIDLGKLYRMDRRLNVKNIIVFMAILWEYREEPCSFASSVGRDYYWRVYVVKRKGERQTLFRTSLNSNILRCMIDGSL